MTVREARAILFAIEDQEATIEFWHNDRIIDVAEIIPQPTIPSNPGVVSLLINS